ncbi:MAG: 30S ribosomal protein S4 [Candidatus Eisenbacteria bacterium]|nr:30S ribosomal protein S4 [Candidatus Eisenbacteria bacterium]
MATYHGPRCRLCRAHGMKLFLKGARCSTDKCAFERRAYGPGEHGNTRRRRKVTDYGTQLKEKQKAKRIYGILERQFKNYYKEAERQRGVTGENLMRLLERRLDSIVYRLGFAPSRSAARELIVHGHFEVNGRKVDIPSYLVKSGDEIVVREKSRGIHEVRMSIDSKSTVGTVEWLELDPKRFVGRVLDLPSREQIPTPVNEQLIVNFYSR